MTGHTLLRPVLTLLAALCLALHAETVKRRGRYLHTEVTAHEDRIAFSVTLTRAKTPVSTPIFRFNRLIERTYHEIKVFETVLETVPDVRENHPYEQFYAPQKVLPNEFIRANPSTRTETLFSGPFANETFTVQGIPVVTDASGHAPDTTQLLLKLLDDLTVNAVDVTVSHERHGTRKATVTRLILRREEPAVPEYRKQNPNATLDVLDSMALPFLTPPNAGRTTLRITCNLPADTAAGDVFPVTVTVTNTGKAVAGNVLVGSHSREPWLNGILFYIGNLDPGQSRSFMRLVTAEPGKTDRIYVTFAAWDTVLQARNTTPLTLLIRRRTP